MVTPIRQVPNDVVKKMLFKNLFFSLQFTFAILRGSEEGMARLCASGIRVSLNFTGRRFCTAPNAMTNGAYAGGQKTRKAIW